MFNHFFTFYKDIKHMQVPLISFGIAHLLLLIFVGSVAYLLFQRYKQGDAQTRQRYQIYFARYFLWEEVIYTCWLLLVCKKHVFLEIVPLELCSLCCYMNIASVYLKKDYLRFFSGLVGIMAGSIALLYPANIASLYPALSYRSINFFLLHMMFILFGVIQFYEYKLYDRCYLKKNLLIVAGMFVMAFCFNLIFHTQYMFVGIPPKIKIITSIYEMSGFFFLPVAILIVSFFQLLFFYLIKSVHKMVVTE
ncbi:MAG: hypothetical protein EOM50_03365 [Erysipelotrichia bacterium]|nr:hypothetical protein [Erysipelotrichia bacterium]NCC54881.1 hypothetical protein [Erysipelotrichia bacterium]